MYEVKAFSSGSTRNKCKSLNSAPEHVNSSPVLTIVSTQHTKTRLTSQQSTEFRINCETPKLCWTISSHKYISASTVLSPPRRHSIAKTTNMPTSPTHPIPSIYRFFFTTFEPLLLIFAIYNMLLHPFKFLDPQLPSTPTITPELNLILIQMASLYAFFAITQGILLRCTTEIELWNVAVAAMMVADFGHCYSMLRERPEGVQWLWRVDLWKGTDWPLWGITEAFPVLRMAYFLGLGFTKKERVE